MKDLKQETVSSNMNQEICNKRHEDNKRELNKPGDVTSSQ